MRTWTLLTNFGRITTVAGTPRIMQFGIQVRILEASGGSPDENRSNPCQWQCRRCADATITRIQENREKALQLTAASEREIGARVFRL
jgi:hypothetical protein